MALDYHIVPYQSEWTDLTTTNATAVFTALDQTFPTASHLHIGNDGAGSSTVTVEIYDASTTATFVFCYQLVIFEKGCLELDMHNMRLDVDDEIRVTAGDANFLHAFVTVIESAGRSG